MAEEKQPSQDIEIKEYSVSIHAKLTILKNNRRTYGQLVDSMLDWLNLYDDSDNELSYLNTVLFIVLFNNGDFVYPYDGYTNADKHSKSFKGRINFRSKNAQHVFNDVDCVIQDSNLSFAVRYSKTSICGIPIEDLYYGLSSKEEELKCCALMANIITPLSKKDEDSQSTENSSVEDSKSLDDDDDSFKAVLAIFMARDQSKKLKFSYLLEMFKVDYFRDSEGKLVLNGTWNEKKQ